MGIQKSRKRLEMTWCTKKSTRWQNAKIQMRSAYSNDVSSSSKEPSLKPKAKSSCIASSQVNELSMLEEIESQYEPTSYGTNRALRWLHPPEIVLFIRDIYVKLKNRMEAEPSARPELDKIQTLLEEEPARKRFKSGDRRNSVTLTTRWTEYRIPWRT